MPVLAPHEVLHMIFRSGTTFVGLGNPTEARCTAYWHAFLEAGLGAEHPINDVPLQQRGLCVPLHWHFDEVKVARSSGGDTQLMVASWSCAFARGEVTRTKFVFASLPVHLSSKRSNYRLAELVIEAQKILMTGRVPLLSEEKAGENITPGGHRFFFAGLKYDMEAKQKFNSFSRSYRHDLVCEWCQASKKHPNLFGDFREHAQWTSTYVSHAEYMRHEANSSWCTMPGWTLRSNFPDGMHNLFHNGLASNIVASVLRELCSEHVFAGDDLKDQLLNAHAEFMHWSANQLVLRDYDRHYVKPFVAAKFGLESQSEYPCVSTEYKCSSVRMMLMWLGNTYGLLASDDYISCRSCMLRCLCNYVSVTRSSDFILTDAERALAYSSGRTALCCLQFVSHSALQQGRCVYRILPKAHAFDHTLRTLLHGEANHGRLNPYYWENCCQESLLGKVKKIAARVHARTILGRTLQRYVLRISHEMRIEV